MFIQIEDIRIVYVIHINTVQKSEVFIFASFSKKQSIGLNINS